MKSKFKITEFKNPSGATVWRLSGMLNSKHIRENFKFRKEALAQRGVYGIEFMNNSPVDKTIWTTLTAESCGLSRSAV
jgi:hypothetical protein